MKRILKVFSLGLLTLISCTKIDEGYISDNMFYQVRSLSVQQGVTTYSAPLIGNGSTNPLNVKLLRVKDSNGSDVTKLFQKPQSIVTFLKEITSDDNTLEKLSLKLRDSLVTPFQVNSLGGRLEFTAATSYLPAGKFTIDLEVGNVRGTKFLENICEIDLRPVERPYFIAYKRVQHSRRPDNTFEYTGVDDSDITVRVEFTAGTENSSTVFQFLDKNGDLFNPKEGEVTRYRDDFPFFDTWNPYYPLQTTDTEFSQILPNIGLKFPYFGQVRLGERNWVDESSRYDWKIPAGYLEEINGDLVGLISFQFYASGTYKITTQLHKLTKRKT